MEIRLILVKIIILYAIDNMLCSKCDFFNLDLPKKRQ